MLKTIQSEKKTLVIVQNRPTQFDAPLYDFLHRRQGFHLVVYYTETHLQGAQVVDAEIGHAPLWDHLVSGGYERYDLTAAEAENSLAVAHKIAMNTPDLVILCGYFPKLHRQLVWSLKRKGIRIGLRSDNTLPHSDFRGIKGIVKHLILPHWLSLYDTWHPVGTLAERYLQTMADTIRPTFLFAYNVDNQWFSEMAAKYRVNRPALRAGFGWTEDDFVVLGVMKWHEREDPMTLMDAFARFSKHRPDARLLMVGDGSLREVLRQKAAVLGDKVILPGYAAYSELPKYYALSDVFVHPAVNEPWGVSVNEAMACGLPVIAAEGVGAAVDLIVNGENGFTFANRDAEQLAERLVILSEDREQLTEMESNATRRISEWSYRQTFAAMQRALAYC